MPVKNLDRYSQVRPCIKFYSKKNNAHMFAESHVEIGALYELENDPTVIRYQTQPTSYSYRKHGDLRRYTPDTLVKLVDNSYHYEETKDQPSAEQQKFVEKFLFLQHLFQNRIRVPLRLRISVAPHNCPVRENLQYLYPYLGDKLPPAALRHFASIKKPVQLKVLIASAKTHKLSSSDVFTALANGILTYDRSILISTQVMVGGTSNAA